MSDDTSSDDESIRPLKKEYLCIAHKQEHNNNQVMSPCRSTCKLCHKKKVHGYTNPDHVCNPFGYLYLCPIICDSCADDLGICIWCIPE